MDLALKLSAAVDAEAQTREWSTELSIRIAGENAQRLQMIHERARVFTTMNGLGTRVEYITVRMDSMMDKLRVSLTTLIRTSSRAA